MGEEGGGGGRKGREEGEWGAGTCKCVTVHLQFISQRTQQLGITLTTYGNLTHNRHLIHHEQRKDNGITAQVEQHKTSGAFQTFGDVTNMGIFSSI